MPEKPKNDVDIALANMDKFIPYYKERVLGRYTDPADKQSVEDSFRRGDIITPGWGNEEYKGTIRSLRAGDGPQLEGNLSSQLNAVNTRMRELEKSFPTRGGGFTAAHAESLASMNPEYAKLKSANTVLNNLVGDFKDSRDQLKKTLTGIAAVAGPFAAGTILGAPAAAGTSQGAGFVGPPTASFTDKLAAVYNSGASKVAGGLSSIKNAISPGAEFVGPPTASQSAIGKLVDKLYSPAGALLGLSAAGQIADSLMSDDKKTSGAGGDSYGYGSDYVKTQKSPYRSIFDKERSPMMTDKYERFFRLRDRYAAGGTVEDPYKNYGAGPEKLFFENLDKPITGAGSVSPSESLVNPNQVAKRNAGYTGGFDDVNEFNTWARNNPDSYLKYFDYRRQDDPNFTRSGQIDWRPETDAIDDFGPDLNKALGKLIGYTGDVGGGQMTAYLKANPQHRDTYAQYRRLFEPNYSETFAGGGDVNGPGGGKDDMIPARLSDGEHVITAQEVSALGDGSTDAGHKRLYEMRKRIREHASKNKGGHSPKAKSIANYLKGI